MLLPKIVSIFFLTSPMLSCNGDIYCNFCVNNTECAHCEYSFLSMGKCQVPPKKIDHCYEYDSSAQCKICDKGYAITNQKDCTKIPTENCIEVNQYGVCSVCNNGIKVENGKCPETSKC